MVFCFWGGYVEWEWYREMGGGILGLMDMFRRGWLGDIGRVRLFVWFGLGFIVG